MGRADSPPVPPLNLVGDFGGGGMLLAFGMVAALLEAARSGEGQVVDAAMVDGAGLADDDDPLLPPVRHLERGARRQHARHRRALLRGLRDVGRQVDGGRRDRGASSTPSCSRAWAWPATRRCPAQMERDKWPAMKERFAAVFKTKTRDEWTAIFDGTDACVVPVLSPWEAHEHPHNVARSTFIEVDGVVQPAPGPAFQPHAVGGLQAAVASRAPTRCPGWSSGAWTRGRSPSCASRARSASAAHRGSGVGAAVSETASPGHGPNGSIGASDAARQHR